jgi:hypothetical protein
MNPQIRCLFSAEYCPKDRYWHSVRAKEGREVTRRFEEFMELMSTPNGATQEF